MKEVFSVEERPENSDNIKDVVKGFGEHEEGVDGRRWQSGWCCRGRQSRNRNPNREKLVNKKLSESTQRKNRRKLAKNEERIIEVLSTIQLNKKRVDTSSPNCTSPQRNESGAGTSTFSASWYYLKKSHESLS